MSQGNGQPAELLTLDQYYEAHSPLSASGLSHEEYIVGVVEPGNLMKAVGLYRENLSAVVREHEIRSGISRSADAMAEISVEDFQTLDIVSMIESQRPKQKGAILTRASRIADGLKMIWQNRHVEASPDTLTKADRIENTVNRLTILRRVRNAGVAGLIASAALGTSAGFLEYASIHTTIESQSSPNPQDPNPSITIKINHHVNEEAEFVDVGGTVVGFGFFGLITTSGAMMLASGGKRKWEKANVLASRRIASSIEAE